ncbi:MAG: hypothetical protein J6W64_05525 [Bacilli bacterium]|nr:hypothetical protein [Bacilli bacterium]
MSKPYNIAVLENYIKRLEKQIRKISHNSPVAEEIFQREFYFAILDADKQIEKEIFDDLSYF